MCKSLKELIVVFSFEVLKFCHGSFEVSAVPDEEFGYVCMMRICSHHKRCPVVVTRCIHISTSVNQDLYGF